MVVEIGALSLYLLSLLLLLSSLLELLLELLSSSYNGAVGVVDVCVMFSMLRSIAFFRLTLLSLAGSTLVDETQECMMVKSVTDE